LDNIVSTTLTGKRKLNSYEKQMMEEKEAWKNINKEEFEKSLTENFGDEQVQPTINTNAIVQSPVEVKPV
jgi:hypothetical protein